MRFLEIDSGSTHGEGKLGTGIGEREGCGFRRSGDVRDLWRAGDMKPEDSSVGVVGLDQQLH